MRRRSFFSELLSEWQKTASAFQDAVDPGKAWSRSQTNTTTSTPTPPSGVSASILLPSSVDLRASTVECFYVEDSLDAVGNLRLRGLFKTKVAFVSIDWVLRAGASADAVEIERSWQTALDGVSLNNVFSIRATPWLTYLLVKPDGIVEYRVASSTLRWCLKTQNIVDVGLLVQPKQFINVYCLITLPKNTSDSNDSHSGVDYTLERFVSLQKFDPTVPFDRYLDSVRHEISVGTLGQFAETSGEVALGEVREPLLGAKPFINQFNLDKTRGRSLVRLAKTYNLQLVVAADGLWLRTVLPSSVA